MEILKISIVNMGGENISTIIHQDGWNFRENSKLDGYVRWEGCPYLGNEALYLRGWSKEEDYEPIIGTMKFYKITEFFNSKDSPFSPLDLRHEAKRWVGKFNDEDLAELNSAGIGAHFYKKGTCLYESSKSNAMPVCYICGTENGAFTDIASSKLIDYLTSKFTFTFTKPQRKEVVMTVERKGGIEIRTWILK